MTVERKWYGLIIRLVKHGLQIWIGKDFDSAISSRQEQLLATMAKGYLVGLHALLT